MHRVVGSCVFLVLFWGFWGGGSIQSFGIVERPFGPQKLPTWHRGPQIPRAALRRSPRAGPKRRPRRRARRAAAAAADAAGAATGPRCGGLHVGATGARGVG